MDRGAQPDPHVRRGSLLRAALDPGLAAVAELVDLAGEAFTNVPAFNAGAKLLDIVAAGAAMGMI